MGVPFDPTGDARLIRLTIREPAPCTQVQAEPRAQRITPSQKEPLTINGRRLFLLSLDNPEKP